MQVLQGIAVSPGVAIGEALVIDNEGFRIPRRFVSRDAVEVELARLRNSVESVASEISQNRDAVSEQLGEHYGAIFSAHLQMLRDPRLQDELEELICKQNYSPEYAVSRTLRRYAKVFQSLKSSHLAERAHDVFDIEKLLLRDLLGRRREELSQLTSPAIVLAHNLTPSETAKLDPAFVLAFVTEVGGLGGHTAIVAEALEIPAIVGTGDFLTDVSGGDLLIVDADEGRIFLQPDEDAIARYRQEEQDHRTRAANLFPLHEMPAVTTDGEHIDLLANIEFPHEAKRSVEHGANGIGLYRTEFLYLGAATEPTEETHFEAYADVVRRMEGRPVVIRTLDLGADKLGQVPSGSQRERNPFLGLRSIRMSLRNLPLFRTQLHAILRASALGDVRVMFPMIATLQELRQAKQVMTEIMDDLAGEDLPFDREIQVGMMVEVPSAVTLIDRFVKEVDFLSIGTNDLVQYVLAVDRGNHDVADLYQTADPAVLRLIDRTVQVACEQSVPVSLCGQMSSNPLYTMLLLGLGLRTLSVPPKAIDEVKKVCRTVSIEQCNQVAERSMLLDSPREINALLRDELKKAVPELQIH
jgi:phosphotransferase system enzyme I (PtsI)